MALNPPGQYADDRNLRARQRLWQHQTPFFDIAGWVLSLAGLSPGCPAWNCAATTRPAPQTRRTDPSTTARSEDIFPNEPGAPTSDQPDAVAVLKIRSAGCGSAGPAQPGRSAELR
jgi:hypothetical protein